MKQNLFLLLPLLVLLLFTACEKEQKTTEVNPTGKTIQIDSLLASKPVLIAWDTTRVFCYASGTNLTYEWEADHGTVHGSGDQIYYTAGTCCVGLNTITCRLSNGHETINDTLQIRVKYY